MQGAHPVPLSHTDTTHKMHTHTHTHMHAHMHTHTHTHTHTYKHAFRHAHAHILMHAHTRMHTHTHTLSLSLSLSLSHTHTHASPHALLLQSFWHLPPLQVIPTRTLIDTTVMSFQNPSSSAHLSWAAMCTSSSVRWLWSTPTVARRSIPVWCAFAR